MSTQESPRRLVAGRYRLRSLLGQGAMGVVWAAFDEHLQRVVAVKEVRMPPGVTRAEAAELRERTLREARAIAVLAHPNVVTLHDVVREGEDPFVVMEYLPAVSLAELLRAEGPLDDTQAAVVADAVAAGLQAAHDAGITHRDVKPGNVLVGRDGRVKLSDFGIARNVSERTLTRSGVMLGSPAYIAPEIASGGEVTPRADLWGLGATLFAAVEGRAPYDPDAPVLATLARVVDGEVPQPTRDSPLREVITGLMVKDPAARLSLREVRELVHPLRPSPGANVFDFLGAGPEEDNAEEGPGDESWRAGGGQGGGVLDALRALRDADEHRGDTADDTADDVPGEAPPEAEDRAEGDERLRDDDAIEALREADGQRGRDAVDEVGELRRAEEPAPGEASAALAPAPGPLPFEPPARHRGPAATLALALAALLLFLAAAAGGFALTRVVGGRSPLPPQPPPSTTTPASAPLRDLEVRTAEATTITGERGGAFSIPVPADWVMFTEQRDSRTLPNGVRVHWISPDGTSELVVERIPGFYPDHAMADYLQVLAARTPGYRLVGATPLAATGAPEPPRQVTYRSVETAAPAPGAAPGTDLGRATFANLMPVADDLWVVGLTVPIEQEDSGRRTLFTRTVPEFRPLG